MGEVDIELARLLLLLVTFVHWWSSRCQRRLHRPDPCSQITNRFEPYTGFNVHN